MKTTDPMWWHNQSRTAHPDQCKCPGCSGARDARSKANEKKAKAK